MKPTLDTHVQSRLHALAEYRILDTAPEPEFDDLARLAASICEAPVAMISLLDNVRQWFKARVGITQQEFPLSEAFCRYAIRTRNLLTVDDATQDPRFCDNRLVVEKPRIRFYAGAPLITPAGVPLGALCAIDFVPRSLTRAQRGALQSLARQAVALLELRRLGCERRPRRAPTTALGRCRRSRTMLGAVARIAAAGTDAESMVREALRVVCAETGAAIGHGWIPNSRCVGHDAPIHVRHAEEPPPVFTLPEDLFGGPHQSDGIPLLRDIPMSFAEIPSDYTQVASVVLPMPGQDPSGLLALYHPLPIALGPDMRAALKQVSALLAQAMLRLHSQTVLHLSEKYFRHLVEDALDLITVLDAQGIVQFESHSIGDQLGWGPEEILGHNAFEFVHPDDCKSVMAAFAESLRTEGPTPILSFRFRHKDGTYRNLEGRGNNLLTDPAVRGIVFSSRNITEKTRLEEQFGQLAGGIAHDFNNLLSVIVGYSSKAEAHPQADPKLKLAVEQIQRASERAAGLTGQLLAFTGRQVLQPRAFCVNELLIESEAGLRLLLGCHIRLRLRTPARNSRVHADAAQIDMVLRHLILNAHDALPNGGDVWIESRTVTIGTATESNAFGLPIGEYVLIEVRDSGCGMTTEVCARVFEPYFTTKPLGKGSGMGLATCQGILRQSGGRMAVRSVQGLGSVFSLYLPIATSAAAEAGNGKAPAATTLLRRDARPTVLFAEDEEVLRELGTSILEEMGCRVLTGENGRAALEALAADPDGRLDLLLTDIVMPEMDGKKLADAIRARNPSAPILFCSGYAHDPSFYSGLPEGAAFLAKPYTAAMLTECVNRALAGKGAAALAA